MTHVKLWDDFIYKLEALLTMNDDPKLLCMLNFIFLNVIFAVLIHWILQHRETEAVGLLINQLHQLELFKITSGHLLKVSKNAKTTKDTLLSPSSVLLLFHR